MLFSNVTSVSHSVSQCHIKRSFNFCCADPAAFLLTLKNLLRSLFLIVNYVIHALSIVTRKHLNTHSHTHTHTHTHTPLPLVWLIFFSPNMN